MMRNYKKSGVYVIKNLVNNKVYVGSSKNLYARELEHFRNLKNNKHENKHLQRAYNKYGRDNFAFEVIEFCKEEERFLLEQKYIDKYYGRDNCYNVCKFADLPPEPIKKAVYCIELNKTFASIDEACLIMNTHHSNITTCLNNPHKTSCGYHWILADDIKKYSQFDLFLMTKRVRPDFKDIICLDDYRIFYNSFDVCNEYNIKHYEQIKRCCDGKSKVVNGFHFMCYADYLSASQEEVDKRKSYTINKRKVKCINTGEVFESIAEAGRRTIASAPNIILCCQNKIKNTKGLKFEYVNY